MKQILTRLFEHKELDRDEAKKVLVNISNGAYNEAQIAAFISVYLMRSISVNELLGFRDALLELCHPFDLEGIESIDIVGTGGDGKNTFNISTLSSVVVAGAGYKVTKHGNYGVSSSCGSSNVLEHLGYQFTNETDVLKKQLETANICFLHAPLFHPAMKAVAPVRRQLGVKTFFNMLGPLVNPAQPTQSLLGVYNLELARLYQYIFQTTDRDATIVYSMDGYDEVSLTSPFKLRQNDKERLLQPSDIGKKTLLQSDLHGGGDVPSSAKIFMDVLSGNGTTPQNDVVSTNAGIAINCLQPQKSIQDCISEAHESLIGGKALNQFKLLLN
ncbi:MAG: anthranilate phosphoribosyltransferase [Saprospiraceae bacterium]